MVIPIQFLIAVGIHLFCWESRHWITTPFLLFSPSLGFNTKYLLSFFSKKKNDKKKKSRLF
jgi:hypothetical protein